MSSLVVLAFNGEKKALAFLDKITDLQNEELIHLDDAATTVRLQIGKVKVKQANNLVGTGALGGALFGKAGDYGINEEFIKTITGVAALKKNSFEYVFNTGLMGKYAGGTKIFTTKSTPRLDMMYCRTLPRDK